MRSALFALLLLTGLVGCGSGDAKRFDVSGSVTYAGQPVASGMVFFDPDYSQGSDGVQGFAEIVDGQFNTQKSGRGLGGGKYVVRIRGYGTAPAGKMPPALFDEHVIQTEVREPGQKLAFEVPKTARNNGSKVAVDIP